MAWTHRPHSPYLMVMDTNWKSVIVDMDTSTSISVGTAAKQARQRPDDAAEAIQTLFEYVDDDKREASNAAESLATIASHTPEAFDGQTAEFGRVLEITDDLHPRRYLVEAVNELVKHHAIPPRDAGRALTEATRVLTAHQYWEERPKDGLLIIQNGFKGWTNLAARGKPVPRIVVNRAIALIELEDFNTIMCIIDVLQAAVESGSPKSEEAFKRLVELTQVEEPTPTIKVEAANVVIELVPNGDILDLDAARDGITADSPAARDEKQHVEQALAKNTVESYLGSKDPGICRHCHEVEVRVTHQFPRVSWEHLIGGAVIAFIKFIFSPYAYEDEIRCANPNCVNGRNELTTSVSKISRGLENAARTGDWSGVDDAELERLEQLTERATEIATEDGIVWSDTETQTRWTRIEEKIDSVLQNLSNATEQPLAVENQSSGGVYNHHAKFEYSNVEELLHDLSQLSDSDDLECVS